METINVTIPSTIEHLSQIIAGFLLLNPQDWRVELENASRDPGNPFHDLPVLLARYRGQRIVYDLWDGYQDFVMDHLDGKMNLEKEMKVQKQINSFMKV